VDFNEIDFQYVNTHSQKAYPAAMFVRIIILGTICSIHSSRKLKRIVRKNIMFIYFAGFQTPIFSTITAFKRENSDIIEKIFFLKQLIKKKYTDRIIFYTNECSKCSSKQICLTNRMTGKVITPYTSDAKELLAYSAHNNYPKTQ